MISNDQFRRQAAEEARQMWQVSRVLGGLPDNDAHAPDDFDPSPRAQTVAASAITSGRVEWLWPGRIPLGMLTLFSGDPKLGKSLAALSVLAAVSRGGSLPGGPDGPATVPRGASRAQVIPTANAACSARSRMSASAGRTSLSCPIRTTPGGVVG